MLSCFFCLLRFRVDAKDLLEIDPGLRLAKESVPRLEKLQNDKNELMKEEAIGEFCRTEVPTESAQLKMSYTQPVVAAWKCCILLPLWFLCALITGIVYCSVAS